MHSSVQFNLIYLVYITQRTRLYKEQDLKNKITATKCKVKCAVAIVASSVILLGEDWTNIVTLECTRRDIEMYPLVFTNFHLFNVF